MALFLSALVNDREPETARFSLVSETHLRIHRIWMFAMAKDHPTLSEREHISGCEACGKALGVALGVSGFSAGFKEVLPAWPDLPTPEAKHDDRAVA